MCLDVIPRADTCTESLFGLFLGMTWCLPGEHVLSPTNERHTWISIILLLRTTAKRRFLGVVMRVHLVCLSSLNAEKEGLERSNQMGWLAVSFQLTLPGPEELWPNLCFKETTNKCKQSVSKAGVQVLLLSWSPLHCNVCLSILVTAERSCQLRWPVQIAISKEGEVHVCTSFYS